MDITHVLLNVWKIIRLCHVNGQYCCGNNFKALTSLVILDTGNVENIRGFRTNGIDIRSQ